MRYNIGEEVVLRDDLSKRHFTNMEDIEGKELRITHIDHLNENYCSGPYLFTDDMIDHSKTKELKKDNTLNHYSGELEKVVAEKNKIHNHDAAETKFMDDKFDRHKELTDYMHQTYIRKNKDYGDSFEQTHEKYGAVAGLVRIADKFHRLENIILNNREIQVEDESIIDTLIDMSNYGLLLAMELEDE